MSSPSRTDKVRSDSQLLFKIAWLCVVLAIVVTIITFFTKPSNVGFPSWQWSLMWFNAIISPFWTFLMLLAFVWTVRLATGRPDEGQHVGDTFSSEHIRIGAMWFIFTCLLLVTVTLGQPTFDMAMLSLSYFLCGLALYLIFLALATFAYVFRKQGSAGR